MSDDLIKRSDAIKAVWGEDINPSEDGMVFEAQSHIGRDIKLIPSADRPQEWTPCSERLPEENEEVLVCDEDGTMEVCDLEMFGRGIGLKWTDKNGYECWLNVVAWMPLPEPWKGADDES